MKKNYDDNNNNNNMESHHIEHDKEGWNDQISSVCQFHFDMYLSIYPCVPISTDMKVCEKSITVATLGPIFL